MSGVRQFCVCVRCPVGKERISAPACAAALCELLKYVLYQKLQVPYSFEFWRRAVLGRRDHPDMRESLQSARHYRTASLAFDNLETIFKALAAEMSSGRPPTEVCLVLGATVVSCREVYRLLLPAHQHKPSCSMDHTAAGHHLSLALLKTMTTSEIFDEMIMKPLSPTNLHILIRKPVDSDSPQPSVNLEYFFLSRGCRVPRSAKLAVIRIPNISTHNLSCCSGFEIFDEFSDSENNSVKEILVDNSSELDDMCVIESTDTEQWFQASVVVKGFKDCCVNGISIVNEWLKV